MFSCCFNASLFAIISLFSFSFYVILGVKWMCRKLKHVNFLDDTKNNFIMDDSDNQTGTKTPLNPRDPVGGEN